MYYHLLKNQCFTNQQQLASCFFFQTKIWSLAATKQTISATWQVQRLFNHYYIYTCALNTDIKKWDIPSRHFGGLIGEKHWSQLTQIVSVKFTPKYSQFGPCLQKFSVQTVHICVGSGSV